MKLRDILIAIILFSIIVVGSYGMMAPLYDDYDTPFTNDSGNFDKINEITGITNKMQNQTTDSTTSDFGFALGAWQGVKLMFNTPTIIYSMINEIASAFGIPMFFVSGAIAIVGIVVLFAVISAVFRRGT